MKHIYLNLKRFEVPSKDGGVNRLYPVSDWGYNILKDTKAVVNKYSSEDVEFAVYFPEAQIISASKCKDTKAKLGCQSVFRSDVEIGKNFGAFTANMPSTAASCMGVATTIIGHCEERRDKEEIISLSGGDISVVNKLLNLEIKAALNKGIDVLYCIGEKYEEMDRSTEVLTKQLLVGLEGVDKSKVVIAYEPVWAIGPGKTPPDKAYIENIARLIKEATGGMDVVYGGGLKQDNAVMLSEIEEIDGGLIALTRFSGDFGFYPEEYAQIVELYLRGEK